LTRNTAEMSIFERLAEVRIQDWNRRQARGEVPAEPDAPLGTGETLETQLLADAIDLLERAAGARDAERARLVAEAEARELRLIVSLERQGLSLVAKRMEQEIARVHVRTGVVW
jgi:hypothetical protein